LAGAAYVLKRNERVLSGAHAGQKPVVEHKSKSSVDIVRQCRTVP